MKMVVLDLIAFFIFYFRVLDVKEKVCLVIFSYFMGSSLNCNCLFMKTPTRPFSFFPRFKKKETTLIHCKESSHRSSWREFAILQGVAEQTSLKKAWQQLQPKAKAKQHSCLGLLWSMLLLSYAPPIYFVRSDTTMSSTASLPCSALSVVAPFSQEGRLETHGWCSERKIRNTFFFDTVWRSETHEWCSVRFPETSQP
jgi:hypothetical protein